LKKWDLIVTNEHVVRQNKRVIVKGSGFKKEFVRVVFVDKKRDIALIEPPLNHKMSDLALSQNIGFFPSITVPLDLNLLRPKALFRICFKSEIM
jgi:hypothetical protein